MEEGGWGGVGSCCPTSYPPCNHVGVQLRSEGGVPIGNDSAAKKKSEGGPEGGPEGPPRGGGGGPVGPPVRPPVGFFFGCRDH